MNYKLIAMKRFPSFFGMLLLALSIASAQQAEPDSESTLPDSLRERLKDEHAWGADHWIYNNLDAAMAEAGRTGKPIFVTFRCVPCEACKGFDAEVAQGSEVITRLAREEFVSLRQVEMKGVDLTQFQFDYDLNWAAMFINADGVVYGRYGTQSAKGPDAYNSIAGLKKAMERVLALHEEYPANKEALKGKRGPQKPYATALEMPGLRNKEQRRGPTARNNCIHCHNIHDAEQNYAKMSGTFTRDMLWRFPLPENLGLTIEPDHGQKVAAVENGSPAETAGIQPGDAVKRADGEAIISIADIQWVLDQLPNTEAEVTLAVERNGQILERTLHMDSGWKNTDISWRGSMWSLSPRLGIWAPELQGEELKALELPAGQSALLVKWINSNVATGQSAKEAGLKEGDVIVGLDGEPFDMNPREFNLHVKLNYEVGDQLPLTILRDGAKQQLNVRLGE